MSVPAFSYQAELLGSVKALAQLAFEEDMPDGDVTAIALDLAGRDARARIICREDISMCGSIWFEEVVTAYRTFSLDDKVKVTCHFEDGQRVPAGSQLFTLEGDSAAIVSLERTLLNFLGRGIGIANATNRYVAAVRTVSDHTQVLDTRKTLPGYRYFDKYAVLCGQGQNHRLNLSDQVLIKENHIAKHGGVQAALAFTAKHLNREDIGVQVEVASMEQLQEALDAGCELIMLDNFTPEQVREACALQRGAAQLEVSGGITLDTITDYAQFNPDRISIGAITHSIKAPDLSLLMEEV